MGTLRLNFSGGALEAEYQHCASRLLRRGDAVPERQPSDTFDGDPDAPATRLAVRNWLGKMRQEHDSSVLFSGLLPQLVEAEAPVDLKMACLRSSMDELRHARLCSEVVSYLGGVPELTSELRLPPLAEHPGASPRERALRNLLFIGCLSETVAVAFLTECGAWIEDPYIARVNRTLLADETLHARLGWQAMALWGPRLTDEERAGMQHFLPVALGFFESEFLERSTDPAIEEPLLSDARALGYSYGPVARELMHETLETVLIPQLEAVGLEAQKAWAARRKA